MVTYENVPATIATLISCNRATLRELDTDYGLEDVWDMLEINAVDAHNQNIAHENKE